MPIPDDDSKKAWARFPRETSNAYAAFMVYLKLPLRLRSVELAFRTINKIPDDVEVSVPIQWRKWCTNFEWRKRAIAHDDMMAERELAKWEERRVAARERDWEQAEALRDIVAGALPSATQFFRRQVSQPQGGVPTIMNEAGQVIQQGVPAQVVVTVAFDVVGMTSVLREASKIQRLTVNESTENINNLTGAALDAALERAIAQYTLEQTPDDDETGDAEGTPETYSAEDDDQEFDGGSEG